ncbi:UNVERIFIED_CONTAM: hypothetical protein NCL1_24647 [Trichonephila clavipes]
MKCKLDDATGYEKNNVYQSSMSGTDDMTSRMTVAIQIVDLAVLHRTWLEIPYRLHVLRASKDVLRLLEALGAYFDESKKRKWRRSTSSSGSSGLFPSVPLSRIDIRFDISEFIVTKSKFNKLKSLRKSVQILSEINPSFKPMDKRIFHFKNILTAKSGKFKRECNFIELCEVV